MNIEHFGNHIITPVLHELGMYSDSAAILLLGTAVQESRLTHLKQLNDGPALGVYQIEPSTHDDIWKNYLNRRLALAEKVRGFACKRLWQNLSMELVGNLFYATAIARIHYKRVPEPLPAATDLEGLAQYWKDHYNTYKGKGTPEEFITNLKKAIKWEC